MHRDKPVVLLLLLMGPTAVLIGATWLLHQRAQTREHCDALVRMLERAEWPEGDRGQAFEWLEGQCGWSRVDSMAVFEAHRRVHQPRRSEVGFGPGMVAVARDESVSEQEAQADLDRLIVAFRHADLEEARRIAFKVRHDE